MASVYVKLCKEAMEKVRAFERVRDDAASNKITLAAMTVINRHQLHEEFTAELLKSMQSK